MSFPDKSNNPTNPPNPPRAPPPIKPDPLAKPYVGPNQFKVDVSHNDKIYSQFSTGNLEAINGVLRSNQILNFRITEGDGMGETLVHAIIKNQDESIIETKKIEIIKELVHKNVSLNMPNQFNRAPIHLAALNGYYNIFKYLIGEKCEYNIVDNYGNAPIHYLVDKFVDECKQGEC